MAVVRSAASPNAPAVRITWAAAHAQVLERHSREHQIATVWHPDAVGETVDTPLGNVRVQVGEPRYQLTTGEVVEL